MKFPDKFLGPQDMFENFIDHSDDLPDLPDLSPESSIQELPKKEMPSIEGDALSVILSCLSNNPHKPNADAFTFMQVSKNWSKLILQHHPILQVIDNSRQNALINKDYIYPEKWEWNLDDVSCLVKSGEGPNFCKILSHENMLLTIEKNKDKEVQKTKKRKTEPLINLNYLLPLYEPTKCKVALTSYLNKLVQLQELSYKIHNVLLDFVSYSLQLKLSQGIVSQEVYDKHCNTISNGDFSWATREDPKECFSLCSDIIMEILFPDVPKDEWEIYQNTKDAIQTMKNDTKTFLDKKWKYLTDVEILVKEMQVNPILLHKIFIHLSPKEKLQSIATFYCAPDNLNVKEAFSAINEINDEWLQSAGVNLDSTEPYPIEGCEHLNKSNINQYINLIEYMAEAQDTYNFFDTDFFMPEMFVLKNLLDKNQIQKILESEGIAEQCTDEFVDLIAECGKKSKIFKDVDLKDYLATIKEIRDSILIKRMDN